MVTLLWNNALFAHFLVKNAMAQILINVIPAISNNIIIIILINICLKTKRTNAYFDSKAVACVPCP